MNQAILNKVNHNRWRGRNIFKFMFLMYLVIKKKARIEKISWHIRYSLINNCHQKSYSQASYNGVWHKIRARTEDRIHRTIYLQIINNIHASF